MDETRRFHVQQLRTLATLIQEGADYEWDTSAARQGVVQLGVHLIHVSADQAKFWARFTQLEEAMKGKAGGHPPGHQEAPPRTR